MKNANLKRIMHTDAFILNNDIQKKARIHVYVHELLFIFYIF